MLERFRSATPEIPKSAMFDAIVVLGQLDKNSGEPRLDSDSRMSILTAGVVEDANASGDLILSSETEEGTALMEEYLKDAFNISDKSIILEAREDTDSSDADVVKRIKRKHSGLKRLGIITTVDAKNHKVFEDAGFSLNLIPPEDILSNRIAASAANSPNTLKQVAIEIGQQFLKYKRLMMGRVALYELGSAT